jgi:glycosyltransferase involved in cell wall biosynthesis
MGRAECGDRSEDGMKDLLLIWNGTLAGQKTILGPLGGGDQVLIKAVNLSGLKPDLILPKSATKFISSHGELYTTVSNFPGGLIGLMLLLIARTLHALVWNFRLRPQPYKLAIATSPFFTELIPLLFSRARRKGAIIYHVIPKRKAVNLATRIRFGLAALENRISTRLINKTCDFIITGNDYAKGQFESMFPGKMVTVLHAGFNVEVIDSFPPQLKNPNQACFLGRLTSQKGIFDLLEVVEQIAKDWPEFRLVIMGSGPERDALAAAIEQRQIKSIILKGFVRDEEKYAILKQSSYFFFPSYEEGWGIALAEAMYCGALAVCYELPHYRSIFGPYPVYVELGNAKQFAERFLETRSRQVSEEQIRFIKQYSDQAVVADLVQKLEKLSKDV